MDFYQYENATSSRLFAAFPERRAVLVVLIFFSLCTGILMIPPVSALDLDNQTLVDNLMNKGDVCFSTGDYTCTFSSYEAAHQIDPSDADIVLWHGEYLSYTGNYTGALEKLDAALALDPEYAEAWYEKGKVLDKLGRFTESGPCYDRAEELDPYYRVPLTGRFPLNVLIGNATIIVVTFGFLLLAVYIYFNERHRQ